MKTNTILLGLLLSITCLYARENPTLTSEMALQRLQSGNMHSTMAVRGELTPLAKRRAELIKGQKPIAIIVGCSDSRVAPEIVFDQTLGDLFVVRQAGNLVGDLAMGSIEYAVDHLHAPLIVILAHEKCGAVDAAMHGDEAPGHIQSLIDEIHPAVVKAKSRGGDVLTGAIKENALRVKTKILASSELIRNAVAAGKVKIVTAYYHLGSGKVTFFESVPESQR